MKPVQIEILLGGNLEQRLGAVERELRLMRSQARGVTKELGETDRMAQRLDGTVRKLVSAFVMKELVGKVATVRGEFQQLEVAFRTMLGNAEQADALMSQLVRTAATTPFGLEEVTKGAKQLLAYGFEADKVNETLIRLGDIAAGLSVPLNDLVYLYGTTMAQGRLYTQDLNQFTGRGIPMISELAKQFGVAEGKVKELVEAGKVGFPEVQKVIESLTDEGGRFGGLMEAQSKTITGQISNIEDALSMMFNEIGQQSEGIINTTLGSVSYIIENYERFGRIMLGLVATYGTYRTAVMAVAAAKGWATAAEALHYNWLLMVEKAQKMLNATMLNNPYVLVATLIAGVVAAMVSMKTEAERIKEAEEAYEAQLRETIEAEEEHRRQMDKLCEIAGDESLSTDTRREALIQLVRQYPSIFQKYGTEYEWLKNLRDIKREIAELDGKKSASNIDNQLADVTPRIQQLKQNIAMWERQTQATDSPYARSRYEKYIEDAKAQLSVLTAKWQQLSSEKEKANVDAWLASATGFSNGTLEAEIKARENLIAKMDMRGLKKGRLLGSGASGVYSRDELDTQLTVLQAEQNRRNKLTDSPSNWASAVKEKYHAALKAYNDFIADKSKSLSQEEFDKQAKILKDAVDTAKKEYDKVKPGKDSDAETEQRTQQKAERQRQQQLEAERKLGLELVAVQQENAQAETEAMKEGLKKKLRQIDDEYQAKKNAIAKQKSDWQADNVKAGRSLELTEEQQQALDTSAKLNEAKRQQSVAEAYKGEFALMRDHLRQYGSYQQQKLAISAEYGEKISAAEARGDAAEAKRLGTQRDRELGGVAAQELKGTIDWGVVFGEFGGMFDSVVKPILEKAREYMGTDEYRNAGAADQEAIAAAVRQMEQATGVSGRVSFEKLGKEVAAMEKAMAALRGGQEEYKESYAALQTAQDNYAKAMATGTAEQQQAAKGALESAEANEAAAAANVSSLQQTADAAQQTVTDTATVLKTSMDQVVGGLQKLAGGSLSGAYEGLIEAGKGMKNLEKMPNQLGDVMGKISDKLESVPVVGWILSIIDIFKDGLSVVISGLLDSVFSAVGGILDDVLSGDLFVSVGESLVSGIGKILDTVTFGGFSSWFDTSNAREVQETIDSLTERNASLQGAIEDLTEEIKAGKGTKSVAAYRQARDLQQQTNANYLQMAMAQAGYHGSHHSWDYYWEGFTAEQVARLSGQIGRQWDGSLWSLSPEEMAQLSKNADMWQRIINTGKGGYGEHVAVMLGDYIAQAGKLEELQTQLYEGLTGMTFDSMYDSFVDSLMDMETEAEDFADNVNEYFMRAMLSNKIGELYSDRLKGWWEKFGASMEDNELSEAERAALSEEYMQYVREAMALRDSLAAATGYEGSSPGKGQSGRSGAFTAMSQDQGTKLEGLFVSVQGHVASIDLLVDDVAAKMSDAEGFLAKIADNTGRSAGLLQEIKDYIHEISRDGVRMR